MTDTINGISLGKTNQVVYTKQSNVIPLTMPTGDSDTTEVWDMLGVTRFITISGVFTGVTATIRSNIEAIEALINGNQTSSVVLSVATSTSAINVKVMSFSATWDVSGVGNRVEYQLQVVEGV